jgi:hypothetical protein
MFSFDVMTDGKETAHISHYDSRIFGILSFIFLPTGTKAKDLFI